ncbi:alpha-xenorhabdolysin family binary toxin subunit B [Pseudomonas sp.]|uniref:alpha-xenorhabdolysin family binary toxin subunit B n=1 Tax=Pseudomonas sp. TaxID=306 RepID=UPI0026373F38|nr:alpha-xenorhabdolysin family binary toxin subunit B [Pseudomonas sp.]
MTTRTAVDNETVDFDTPNLDLMNSSIKTMLHASASADVAFSKTEYLPDLHAKSSKWFGNATESRATLGKACRTIRVKFELSIDQFRMWNDQLAESTEPTELEEVYAELEKIHAGALAVVNTEAKHLAAALSNIDQTFDPSQTKSYLIGLDKDTETFVAGIDKLKKEQATLTDQRKVMTDAIEALESTGLIDTAQNTLLTAEKVVAMGILPPQAVLVEMALEQMKKTLEDAKATLNFFSLITARDKIREHIEAKAIAISLLEKDHSLVSQRVILINAIHELDEQQKILATEFKKVVTSVSAFLTLNKADLKDEENGTADFISNASKLMGYLAPIA